MWAYQMDTDTAAVKPQRRLAPFIYRAPGVIALETICRRDRRPTFQLGRPLPGQKGNQIMDEPEGVVADDKLLLRIEEAAKRLGIGRSLMYRLVLSGQVQSVSLGRLRRVPTEVLREYIERLRVEGSGQSPAA